MKKRIYIGTCGQVVAWKKIPELYSALEINSTFYRFPSEKQIKSWHNSLSAGIAEKDFVLSIKAFQGLTHPSCSPTWKKASSLLQELGENKDKVGCLRLNEITKQYLERTKELCEKLEANFLLFQLPSFCEKEKEKFATFLKFVKESINISVCLEIRWEDYDLLEELFKRFGIIPTFDPLLHKDRWERFSQKLPIMYLRLHGTYDSKKKRLIYNYQYSDEELKDLQQRIFECVAETVVVLFNNTYMKEDALRFLHLLE